MVSPERTFGTKLPDGSWTGLVGMVVREVSERIQNLICCGLLYYITVNASGEMLTINKSNYK